MTGHTVASVGEITIYAQHASIALHLGITSLAAQLIEYWKNGVLDFDVAKVTSTLMDGEDEVRHRVFNVSMVASNVQY